MTKDIITSDNPLGVDIGDKDECVITLPKDMESEE